MCWYKTYGSPSQNTVKLKNTLPSTIMMDKRIMGLKTFRQTNGGEAPEKLTYMLAQMYPITVEAS